MHIIIIPGWREGSCGSKTLRWELRGSGEQEGQALAAALYLQPLQMQHLSLSAAERGVLAAMHFINPQLCFSCLEYFLTLQGPLGR